MNIEDIRDYALSKPGVEEGFPFGETTLVFKTKDKIFLLLSLDESPARFNVKCDPDKALELRETYMCIQPGYHMNKKHWNTVIIDGTLDKAMLLEQIDHSYDLIAGIAGKKKR